MSFSRSFARVARRFTTLGSKRCIFTPQKYMFESVRITPMAANRYSFICFSTNTSPERAVNYDDVVLFKDNQKVLLIDVREPQELLDTGFIPSSINIPLGSLIEALSSPKTFKSKYGRDFPDEDMELVFSCKMGVRAGKAMDAAIKLGFVNSKYYPGSWEDWKSRQNS